MLDDLCENTQFSKIERITLISGFVCGVFSSLETLKFFYKMISSGMYKGGAGIDSEELNDESKPFLDK